MHSTSLSAPHCTVRSSITKDSLETWATDLLVLLRLLPPPPALQSLLLHTAVHQHVKRLPQHQVPVVKTPHTCTDKQQKPAEPQQKRLCNPRRENRMWERHFLKNARQNDQSFQQRHNRSLMQVCCTLIILLPGPQVWIERSPECAWQRFKTQLALWRTTTPS